MQHRPYLTAHLRLCTLGIILPTDFSSSAGLLMRATPTILEQVWLRFATGQPASSLPPQFLAWGGERLVCLGKPALLLVWDNAPWYKSREVQAWIRTHNQRAKQSKPDAGILLCRLPSKSPWLNPIELK